MTPYNEFLVSIVVSIFSAGAAWGHNNSKLANHEEKIRNLEAKLTEHERLNTESFKESTKEFSDLQTTINGKLDKLIISFSRLQAVFKYKEGIELDNLKE